MVVLNVMWSSGPAFASVHKVHKSVLDALDASAVDTWLLQGRPHSSCEQIGRATPWGFPQHLLKGRHFWKMLRPVLRWRLGRALDALAPKAVLLDGMGAARVMLPILATRPEVRVLVILHGRVRLSKRDRQLIAAFSSRQLSLVAVSGELSRALSAELPDWPGGVHSFRSALAPASFAARLLSRDAARARLGLPADGLALGAIGRLVESKGFDTLIRAFARVAAHYPRACLTLVGDGEAREALAALVAQLGLAERVRQIGHREDAALLYRAFDWIAIPSHEEGLGLVLQESVMADVPVLLSDIPVFREQLGESELYAPAKDVEAWARLLDVYLAEAPAPHAAAQRARLRPEQAWQLFRRSYRDLLGVTD